MTSDYLVRGISRSDDAAALQSELHFLSDSGLVMGVFGSNAQVGEAQPRGLELDPFLGFGWSTEVDWRGHVRATYYSYPWNRAGSGYNYAELHGDVVYRDLVQLAAVYSPDAPRLVANRGLVGGASRSIEGNLQQRFYDKASAIAGIGYSNLGGPAPGNYVYWSVGGAYELRAVALTLSYVGTSGAKSLFYQEKTSQHLDATIIYHF